MALEQATTFQVHAETPELVEIMGSWETNGVSAPSAAKNLGKGFTVARTGVGTAEVTYSRKYNKLIHIECGIQRSALSDSGVQAGVHTAPTQTAKGKVGINHIVLSTGLAAEWPAANADNRVHFTLTFRRTKNI